MSNRKGVLFTTKKFIFFTSGLRNVAVRAIDFSFMHS